MGNKPNKSKSEYYNKLSREQRESLKLSHKGNGKYGYAQYYSEYWKVNPEKYRKHVERCKLDRQIRKKAIKSLIRKCAAYGKDHNAGYLRGYHDGYVQRKLEESLE